MTTYKEILDQRHFQLLETVRPDDDYSYDLYRPLENTLFLVSKVTGLPLAAIAITTRNGMSTLITHRRKPSLSNFLAIGNQDDQDLEFVLTNLTQEGLIKIDILKSNKAVQEVDPGINRGAINQVNELIPYQSYTIHQDQSTTKPFHVSAIKDHGKVRSVTQDESLQTTQGSYIYIAVTPQNDRMELIRQFADVEWECLDFFFLKSAERKGLNEATTGLGIICCCLNIASEKPLPLPQHYFYDVPSNVTNKLCCICLAINPRVRFRTPLTDTEIKESGRLWISESLRKDMTIDNIKTIYSEEDCIFCLESGPDVVFYKCGHQCSHAKCLPTGLSVCPMCRKHITAILNLQPADAI